jgi:sporulation protein YlmC with PRC-barrel domain
VDDKFSGQRLILLAVDVRDVVPQGLAINDHEVLSDPDELVRLKPILEINFELLGKYVRSQSGKRYGKVTDFAVETSSLVIKKIYASQPIVKNLSGGNLSIDRTQIVEITNSSIIIEDPDVKDKAPATAPAAA